MISSQQNPAIKQIRKLHRVKERREQNLCLIEGTHLLETVFQVNGSLDTVCFTEDWRERHPRLVESAVQRARRVETVTPEVLASIATTVNPDGVIATIVRENLQPPVRNPLQIGLVLERLQDPGNLGTIIRTAVATGVDGVWSSADSVEIDNPKVLRSSAGEWFRVPMGGESDLVSLVKDYQKRGVRAIATLPTATKTHWEIDFTRPSLILLGNEGAGLSAELAGLADEAVRIPLMGGVESLNVAIATAVILYEARRQLGSG
ncbi:RNA methyltransferase [Pannus brasiliensis CCIBt3594]|uniref:RNA methyltransferase n=1 Tax=Pannus brasiliensis CCIBt3594 TaxID=1427578 RepID=A0AAW9QQT5_9CHRO